MTKVLRLLGNAALIGLCGVMLTLLAAYVVVTAFGTIVGLGMYVVVFAGVALPVLLVGAIFMRRKRA